MLLVVDAGNTNIVFAVHDGTEWRGRWRVRTDAERTSDEYAVWLLALLQHAGLKPTDITRCAIGTVVPAALYNLRRLCRDWFGCEPLIARASLEWGFEIRVDNPDEVGADRLLNALSGHRRFGGPLIVVDFGTATTFDVSDYSGAYKGGIIAPGINLSLDALVSAAAKLPRIAIEAPVNGSVIGRNTVDQMTIGVYFGYIAMIEGLVARMKAEIGRPAKVIATGGLATLFEQHTDVFDVIEPDLTIQGLAIMYQNAHIG